MPSTEPNHRLERMMREAGFTSRKSLARAVLDESALVSGPFERCDHTDVARWLNGMTPRGNKPVIIAAAIGRKLGRRVTVAEIGMTSAIAAITPHLGLELPETVEAGTSTVTALWHADLAQVSMVSNATVDPAGWGRASLRWLISPGIDQQEPGRTGVRIGQADVSRFKVTTAMFAELDGQFGGGHVRQALIQYLAADGDRLLRGRCTERVGMSVLSAVAEATLLAAWMTYDSAPGSGLAQRYFVQALSLAQAAGDRMLGASILDAMSHQATFTGRYREAADLAMAARTGTRGIATATLTAHFHSMEARAYARLDDETACDRALSDASAVFERRRPADDPEWFRYFDEAELSAEIGHCFRDLRRPQDAAVYASQCLAALDPTVSPRSQFFATMVLADAYLGAGEVDQACATVLDALKLGEPIRSARCVNYLREFRQALAACGATSIATNLDERAREFRLWRVAGRPAA
ncbi:MAG: hypothetical protein ACYCO9_21980 [Streptosporangiaceae bacterium]